MKGHIVLQKAKDILEDHDKKIKDFETICKAGICPTCGETLTLNPVMTEKIETVGIIFKKKRVTEVTYTYIVCPKGHRLIHPKGHDVSQPGYAVWDGCINKEIDEYWKYHFANDDD